MERRLILEDNEGHAVRAFAWDGGAVKVVRRGDNRRLELVRSTEELELRKVPFEFLGDLTLDFAERDTFPIGPRDRLRIVPNVDRVAMDQKMDRENPVLWNVAFSIVLTAAIAGAAYLLMRSPMTFKNEEKLKQEVIRVVKKIPARQRVSPDGMNRRETAEATKPQDKTPKAVDRVRRMGALGALGSLKSSRQRGGLNLGAATTSAGPGLGGSAGSGGVQTSLYAKGLTAAPLGEGGRVQGAGGYGTKGRGGGQAGYGKLSMVGSAGAGPIGLVHEASVASGLDRDAIAAVINKNIGQVRFCYEQGLQGDPSLNGRVAVDFVIGGAGAVKTASVANSTIHSKIVEDCILLRLRSWKFPLPQGGADVAVSYPFVLRRAGQG